jgi:hypothetical protein
MSSIPTSPPPSYHSRSISGGDAPWPSHLLPQRGSGPPVHTIYESSNHANGGRPPRHARTSDVEANRVVPPRPRPAPSSRKSPCRRAVTVVISVLALGGAVGGPVFRYLGSK